MIHYQVLYWRDIPAQIKVYAERRPTSVALSSRFQVAIDAVAMQQKITGTDAYLEFWQWSEKREWQGEPEQAANALLQQVEQEGDQVLKTYKDKA
jgi:hypothetical protein